MGAEATAWACITGVKESSVAVPPKAGELIHVVNQNAKGLRYL